MDIAILTGVQIGRINRQKNSHIPLRNVLFKAYFSDEDHLYANCLFYIFPLCLKCLLFQVHTRGIRMHVSIRTGVEKGHIRGCNNDCVVLKELLLFCKLNFKHKSHVEATWLFCILDNFCKCRPLQSLLCGIRMHIAILTGVQIEHISGWKMVIFC